MNRILFFRLAFILLPVFINTAKSQPDHFAYAVTAVDKGGSEWVAFRKLDIRTGEFSSILRNVQDKDQQVMDLPAAKSYANNGILHTGYSVSGNSNPQPGPGSSVAAVAYDRKNNRLYYTPMLTGQLHYIDLSSMAVYPVPDQFFSKAGHYILKNDGPVNRMVIAPDDYGYTITNDGTHLMRFNTSGAPVITDLGDLIDDPQNKEMTIHSVCANSGGDLVADDAGHLYLITGSNKVFKVDIQTRMAVYLATLSGLPPKFTTSGAAVSEDGKQLLVSSVTYSDACYLVDPETWNAVPFPIHHEMFVSADLANSNVLFTNTTTNSGFFISKSPQNQNQIRIFPNPVMEDKVSIQFNNLPPGNYTIQLASLLGKNVIQQKAAISGPSQTEVMHIPGYAPQGFYYIRILDEKNNVVRTQKLVVERW